MNDPFAILGVDEDADDATIRKAYLQQVRAYPPEQNPNRFQEIRAAYEAIADERDRIGIRLFHTYKPDFSFLMTSMPQSGKPIYPDEQSMLTLLAESLKKFPFPFNSLPEAEQIRQNGVKSNKDTGQRGEK